MIIYGVDQNYLKNSFMVKKLNNLNIYWDYKMFTDHISFVDNIKMVKSLIKDKVIFFSLESSIHSSKYWRPYNLSDFNISHKNIKNCIYYNLLAEDYLNGFLKNDLVVNKKYNNSVFVSSNSSKIKYVQNLFGEQFSNISFYGLFANKVDNITDNFHLNAQNLISQYKSAICIENSEEIGYVQGSFLFALMSGTVPILKASKYILKNILVPECYIELNDYCIMSNEEKNREINKKSEYILSKKQTFTNLLKDYLEYIKEINLKNIPKAVKDTQEFKKKIFDL
tara:strand:- start:157 stop:1002 length:846 start_codon:yes stop_codon:yes gene_type:complete